MHIIALWQLGLALTNITGLSHICTTPARVSLSVWTCLLMVWLLPAGQGGFTVHRVCLEDGHMY